MLSEQLAWILGLVSTALLFGAVIVWSLRRRRGDSRPMPTEWTLTARPVFNADERRVYRQLREALPNHIVLSKLPLVRFCQPIDPQQVRYWYELLGSIHVGFAICSANGRVLAAIDIDNERSNVRRSMHIKQKVLAACKVRYLRCPVDHLPSIPELQLLVPQAMAPSRGPLAPPVVAASQSQGHGRSRHRQHRTLWQDSGFFHDSFFGTDSRSNDLGPPSDFSSLGRGLSVHEMAAEQAQSDEVVGVVVGRAPLVRH